MNMTPVFKHLGRCDYQHSCTQMRAFTHRRTPQDMDEVWFLEHNPVFTLGTNARQENIPSRSGIPLVQSDRGGDITYHGPGQLVMYCLFDLKRLQLGVKSLVSGLEQICIEYLSAHKLVGERLKSAPGVYVDHKKIACLGLRVKNGCCFHGMAINVDMDLTPFSYIHPCGLAGMQVTQLSDLALDCSCRQLAADLTEGIIQQFYT